MRVLPCSTGALNEAGALWSLFAMSSSVAEGRDALFSSGFVRSVYICCIGKVITFFVHSETFPTLYCT